jgi:hypothetical protein
MRFAILAAATMACSHHEARPSSTSQGSDAAASGQRAVTFAPDVDDAGVRWLCRGSDGVVRARIFNFDNGPDYPSQGMRRYVDKGKMGFVDLQCRIVIRATWDFVEAFDGGTARVCVGCTFVPDGEHMRIEGGSWSAIDPTGREVRDF